MLNIEPIITLIEESFLPKVQKNIWKGFIIRVKNDELERQEAISKIETVGQDKHVTEIVLLTDEVIIYKVAPRNEFDRDAPFRVVYKNEREKWTSTHIASPTFEVAFLSYLGDKYDGANSQFVYYAQKMLSLKTD